MMPRRPMVRLRILIPSIEVRILAGHPLACALTRNRARCDKNVPAKVIAGVVCRRNVGFGRRGDDYRQWQHQPPKVTFSGPGCGIGTRRCFMQSSDAVLSDQAGAVQSKVNHPSH